MRLAPSLLLLAAACKAPPPAPEGLDESARYLVREFFADDATFQAGVQGFVNWFDDEGVDLVGVSANVNNAGAFTVGDLLPEDVVALPLTPDLIIANPGKDNEERAPRDVADAAGVVSLAQMACPVHGDELSAEALLARPDQDVVFCKDFTSYDRTYETDRSTFEASWGSDLTPVRDRVDPYGGDFDADAYADMMLFTVNDVDPTRVLVADIEQYTMDLVFRHGTYELDEGPLATTAVLTFTRDAAWGDAGANALLQSYSVEINVERDGQTIRMLAVWAQPKGSGIQPDDNAALAFAVNKAGASSARMSNICAGLISPESECE